MSLSKISKISIISILVHVNRITNDIIGSQIYYTKELDKETILQSFGFVLSSKYSKILKQHFPSRKLTFPKKQFVICQIFPQKEFLLNRNELIRHVCGYDISICVNYIKEITKMTNPPQALSLLDKLIQKIQHNLVVQEKIQEISKEQAQQIIESKQEKVEEPKIDVKKQHKKKQKQNKPEGKKQQKPKLPQGADQDVLIFSECDLRISEIVDCWKHPESTYLYCQKILVGNELREIASGLQQYIKMEDMKGKVIVFANLKPRPLGGFNSNGMVICASNQNQTQFDLLCPEGPLGQRLYLEGYEELFTKSEEILPIVKKRTLQKCKQHFSTDAEGFVVWKGIKLRSKSGYIKSKLLSGLVD